VRNSVLILLALLQSGCAYGIASKEAPPRALNVTPQAPSCVLFCFIHNTQGDVDETISSQGGGAITNTQSQQLTDSSKDTAVPVGVDADVANKQGTPPQ
jgi:hypothetical protein